MVKSSVVAAPTDIKAIVADKHMVYVGSSNGRIVAVPIDNLLKPTEHAELDDERNLEDSDDHSTAALPQGGSKVKGDADMTARIRSRVLYHCTRRKTTECNHLYTSLYPLIGSRNPRTP